MLAVKKRRLIVVKRLLLTIMKRYEEGGGWPDLGAENPRARSLVPPRLADISG